MSVGPTSYFSHAATSFICARARVGDIVPVTVHDEAYNVSVLVVWRKDYFEVPIVEPEEELFELTKLWWLKQRTQLP